eukprot:scaffold1699_cov252-Ochromonas_danica.AAC.11
MGTIISANRTSPTAAGKSVEEILRFVTPVYHTRQPLSPKELEAVILTWRMIAGNKCPEFNRLREANPNLEWKICPEYFPIVFYDRLFDVHPQCRQLFLRPINKQGGYLVQYLSLCIDQLTDPIKLKQSLIYLAQVHNKIGIKAYEYGIVGECLLWALERVIGKEDFTEDARNGILLFVYSDDIILSRIRALLKVTMIVCNLLAGKRDSSTVDT